MEIRNFPDMRRNSIGYINSQAYDFIGLAFRREAKGRTGHANGGNNPTGLIPNGGRQANYLFLRFTAAPGVALLFNFNQLLTEKVGIGDGFGAMSLQGATQVLVKVVFWPISQKKLAAGNNVVRKTVTCPILNLKVISTINLVNIVALITVG